MLFRVPVLGGLQDHILVILDLFRGPFWKPFWALLEHPFFIDFQGVSRILPKSKMPENGRDLRPVWGPSNRSKEADQLTNRQQISKSLAHLTCRTQMQ